MTYNIRLLTVEDINVYKNIRLEALKINPEAFVGTYEEESLLSDDEFRRHLISTKIFGVFFEEQIIGIIGFKKGILKKIQHSGELIGLYITPEFRNRGIGDILINYAIEHAKSHVSQLSLYCNTENNDLVRFYQKHGFTILGIYPKGMKLGDKFYDTNIMFRTL